jgi:hypothetical protein
VHVLGGPEHGSNPIQVELSGLASRASTRMRVSHPKKEDR